MSPKDMLKSQPLVPVNGTLFGRSLCRCDQAKMRPLERVIIRSDWCPHKKRRDTDRDPQGKLPCDNKGRDWSDDSTNQVMSRTAGDKWKQGERQGTDSLGALVNNMISDFWSTKL